MRRILVSLGLALLVSGTPSAGAQDVLTLDAAVAAALAGNPRLAAAHAGAAEAEAGADAAGATRLPRVVFGESWQRSNQPVFAFGALLNARAFTAADFDVARLNRPGGTSVFRAAMAVEQVLFDGGRTGGAVDAAEAGATAAAASARAAMADTALAVTQGYGRLLEAERGLRAAGAAVDAAVEDRQRAERRRDAGTATDADVLLLAVHEADVRQQAIALAGDVDVRRAELNRLMGAPLDATFTTADPSLPPTLTLDLAALQAEAEGHRPEIERAAAMVAAAEADARQARGGWWPAVTAQAGYELNGLSFGTRSPSWIVGADLRWSWSTGNDTGAAARGAAHGVTRARAEADDVRASVRLDVLTALRALESAEARQAVGRAAADLARESQRIIRNRYEAGLAATTDVLQAAAAVLDAERQSAAALADRLSAAAALDRAIGRVPRYYEVSQ